jgi:hypothetical protein
MKKITYTIIIGAASIVASCGSNSEPVEETVIEQQDSMDEANQEDAFSDLLEEESTEKDTAS